MRAIPCRSHDEKADMCSCTLFAILENPQKYLTSISHFYFPFQKLNKKNNTSTSMIIFMDNTNSIENSFTHIQQN